MQGLRSPLKAPVMSADAETTAWCDSCLWALHEFPTTGLLRKQCCVQCCLCLPVRTCFGLACSVSNWNDWCPIVIVRGSQTLDSVCLPKCACTFTMLHGSSKLAQVTALWTALMLLGYKICMGKTVLNHVLQITAASDQQKPRHLLQVMSVDYL